MQMKLSMNKKINIIGAGGHSRSLISLLYHNNYIIDGIYDNTFNADINEEIMSVKVRGKISNVPTDSTLILSIGDNGLREKYFHQFNNLIAHENILHPTAYIETPNKAGNSNQIFAKVYINAKVNIGINNIINSGAIIEHEVCINNHNHISVGSILCGRVKIGSNCFIGAGATVIDKISICDHVIIGANSVVIKNIDSPGTYVGNPARRIK